MESRSTPGIESTETRVRTPSTMNSGQIRSAEVSTFSHTMRRDHSDLRLRRMRVVRSSGVADASASTGRRRDSIGRPYLIAMGGSRLKLLLFSRFAACHPLPAAHRLLLPLAHGTVPRSRLEETEAIQ